MATIKISDLHSVGSELFMDSESYLNELTDEELNTQGGFPTVFTPASTPACVIAISVSTVTITIATSTIRLP
jgi:hypothetical protein